MMTSDYQRDTDVGKLMALVQFIQSLSAVSEHENIQYFPTRKAPILHTHLTLYVFCGSVIGFGWMHVTRPRPAEVQSEHQNGRGG